LGRHWLLELAYDGSCYQGWQSQPHGNTVQQKLEAVLGRLYNTEIQAKGSGRTDNGVHALGLAVAFDAPDRPELGKDKLLAALGGLLPRSIRAMSAVETPAPFNPRFAAYGKAYTYVVGRQKGRAPFLDGKYWHNPDWTRLAACREAAEALVGEHDFSSFAVEIVGSGKNPVRRLHRVDFEEFGPFLCVTFVGNGFLYKMVRSLVGTLALVGEGKLDPAAVAAILEARDRGKAGQTAPPDGLYLMKVFYHESEALAFKLPALPFLCPWPRS